MSKTKFLPRVSGATTRAERDQLVKDNFGQDWMFCINISGDIQHTCIHYMCKANLNSWDLLVIKEAFDSFGTPIRFMNALFVKPEHYKLILGAGPPTWFDDRLLKEK